MVMRVRSTREIWSLLLQTVVAFGHSHLSALCAAYAQLGAQPDISYKLVSYQFLRSDRPHIVKADDIWRYNPDIEAELVALLDKTKPDAVAIMLQGEQAISSGLAPPEEPYDFFFPWDQAYIPNPGSTIIPFDLIFEACVERYQVVGQFLTLIRNRLPSLSFALCPPPPVGDDKFILDADIQHANISQHVAKFGLSPIIWRRRIWKLHTMVLQNIYAANDIGFIDPPPESYSDDGSLLTKFRSDVFHANACYGRLLLGQISHMLANSISQPGDAHV